MPVLKLTLRGLRSHLLRLVATLLAVVIGVGFMVGTQVLGATVKASFGELFADVNQHVDAVARSTIEIEGPFGSERGTLPQDLAQRIASGDGIASAEGAVRSVVRLIDADGEPVGDPRSGAPTFLLNWFTSDELNGWEIVEGRAPRAAGEAVLAVSSAEEGGFAVGERIRVGTPALVELRVVGTARFAGLDSLAGSGAVLVDLPTAQASVGQPGVVDNVVVAGEEGLTQDEVVAATRAALEGPAPGAVEPGVGLVTGPGTVDVITGEAYSEESAGPFLEFVDDFVLFINVFGYIALFVGGFIIYNTFSVIVAQRTRELALLRAVGASRRQVMTGVVTEALVVGLVAGGLGVFVGYWMAVLLRWGMGRLGFEMPDTAIVVEPFAIAWPAGIAVAITVVAAAVPARRASRVAPVEAITTAAVDDGGTSRLRLASGLALTALATWSFVDAFGRSGSGALLRTGLALAITFVLTVVLGALYVKPMATVLGAPLARLTTVAGSIARLNARRNPNRTATTTAALTIAVALVTVIAIAAASVTESINAATRETFAGDLMVRADSFQGLPTSVAGDLAALDEVDAATGIRVGLADVQGAGRLLVGLDPAAATDLLALESREGSLRELSTRGVAISVDEAADNSVGVGDVLMLRFLDGSVDVLTIEAVYDDSGLLGGGSRGVIVHHETFDRGFPPPMRVDQQVIVKYADGVPRQEARTAVEQVLESYPTAEALDVDQLQAAQASEINQAVAFLYALLFLSVLVALIGVVNTLLLAVFERTRELGLLRAVGATRRQVRGIILGESVIIAVMGTALGTAVGVLFGWAMVRALAAAEPDLAHFAVPTAQLAWTVGLAIVAGVGAGWFPARRAARLDVLAAIATD